MLPRFPSRHAIKPNGFASSKYWDTSAAAFLQSKLLEWTAPTIALSPFSALLFIGVAAMLWARKTRPHRRLAAVCGVLRGRSQRAAQCLFDWLLGAVVIASYLPVRSRRPGNRAIRRAALVLASLAIGLARGQFLSTPRGDWRFPSGAADFGWPTASPRPCQYVRIRRLSDLASVAARARLHRRARAQRIHLSTTTARILYNHSAAMAAKPGSACSINTASRRL